MKRLCLLLLLVPNLCFAPNGYQIMTLIKSYPVYSIEKAKLSLLTDIIRTEKPSTNQEAWKAYERENAVGILQIRPVMVRACNEIVGYQKYFLADRRDSTKSVEMFYTFMDRFNPKYDYEKGCYLWNGGEGYEKKSLKYRLDVVEYWIKVRKHI